MMMLLQHNHRLQILLILQIQFIKIMLNLINQMDQQLVEVHHLIVIMENESHFMLVN